MAIRQKKNQVATSSFYFHKALTDKASSVELLHYPKSSVKGKNGEPQVAAPVLLARGCLESPFRASTNIQWSGASSFLDSLASGISEGFNTVMDVYRESGRMWNQMLSLINQGKIKQSDYGINTQSVMVGGDSLHLKYQGCTSNISIPAVSFTFVNEDDTDFFLKRCSELLKQLLPRQNILTKKDGAALKEAATKSGGSQGEESRTVDPDQWLNTNTLKMFYKEDPPGDFEDQVKGYTLTGATGYFGLRMGYKTIRYLLPTQIDIEMSKSGSVFHDGKWRPLYVIVNVGFTRLGKLFSNDLYQNLLFSDEINATGPEGAN